MNSYVCGPVRLTSTLAFMWKIIRCALSGVVVLAAVVTALLFVLPSDVVTTRYASLADARENNLVARGWLPDILPVSSHNIRTSNNLDLNISEGEFLFTPSEFSSFAAKTKPYDPDIKNPFVSLNENVEEQKSKGFVVSMYLEERSVWVFSCKPDTG